MARLDKEVVRNLAAGRWLEILPALAPGRFEDAITNLGRKVTCPFHFGENDFRFALKPEGAEKLTTAESGRAFCSCGPYVDGFAVLQRANDWSFNEAVREVYAWLTDSGITAPAAPVRPIEQRGPTAEEIETVRNAALKVWNGAWSFNQKKVPYYQARGLGVLSGVQNTRFAPNLWYFELINRQNVKTGEFPALMALVQDVNGQVCGVHRTYLASTLDAKAPVAEQKKMTRSVNMTNGSAVRLYAADHAETLGLTEGLETGHAVRELAAMGYFPDIPGKIPVWAALSEVGIRSFKVPASLKKLKRLIVFTDNDASGIGVAAAQELINRLRTELPDLVVEYRSPKQTDTDYLDVLVDVKVAQQQAAA